jgi:hypothetical protein
MGVRLAKDDTVCGIPAPVARTLLRRIGIHSWYRAGAEEALAKLGVPHPGLAIDDLIQGGMLEVAAVDDGEEALGVTTGGSAVAMASFGRPITRATADRLLAGLLERARAYNADAGKPLFIRRLRVFGSYLDPGVDRLGDVDVEVRLEPRAGLSPAESANYGTQSGKDFRSYIDGVFWPQTEAMQNLKNRSPALNLTPQDIDEITDRSEVVFEAEQ